MANRKRKRIHKSDTAVLTLWKRPRRTKGRKVADIRRELDELSRKASESGQPADK